MSKLDERVAAVVGVNVLRLRRSRGWSQTELARRAGLSRSTIASLEKPGGKYRSVDTDTVMALAQSFEVLYQDLMPPEGTAGPTTDLIEEFESSPWFKALRPTDEEMQWLRGIPRAFWSGLRPEPGAVANALELRRRYHGGEGQ